DHVRLARRPAAQALHPLVHLFRARGHGGVSDHDAARSGRDADLWRADRVAVAVFGATDFGSGRADVRNAMARDAVRHRVLQSPGRRLPRGLSRRTAVRTDWLL